MRAYKEIKAELEATNNKKKQLEVEIKTVTPDELWITWFENSDPGVHFTKNDAENHYKVIQTGITHYIKAPDETHS